MQISTPKLDVRRRALDVSIRGLGTGWRQKNVTILCLPCLSPGLHIVCPTGQRRYYLLLTGIHRLLAPLFTSIRILFEL
jgi:hypothetical protein